MLERNYQSDLIKTLEARFPGCAVIKQDSSYIQGIPDLLILWHDRWAMLEVKASATSREQANQRHYVEIFNNMSFAAFIYPENEEEVLYDLQSTFQLRRSTRVPKR